MVEQKKSPRFYTVPPGTKAKPCLVKECGATVYLIKSPDNPGKWVPVDCGVVGGKVPTPIEHGTGVNHYATCTDPRRFHKPKERPPAVEPSQRELSVDHKPRHCIFCGCTPAKPCLVPKEELDLVSQEAMLDRFHAESVDELPPHVPCRLIQTDPPICSARDCQAKRAELPLSMRRVTA